MSQNAAGGGGTSANKPSTVAVNGNGAMNGSSGHNTQNGNTSSEEDPEEKSLPPPLLGRDSVGKIKMKSDEMNRLQEIAVKSGATNHNNHHQLNNQISPTNNSNNAIKMNNLRYNENGSLQKNQNNIHKNLNNSSGSGASGNSAISVLSSPIPDDNGNLLPKPEINPSVDNKVPLGKALDIKFYMMTSHCNMAIKAFQANYFKNYAVLLTLCFCHF